MNSFFGKTESTTLHFSLDYAAEIESFVLAVGGERHPLQRHTPQTLALYKSRNRALGLLSAPHLARITHFVENVTLPSDASCLLRVEGASAPTGSLPPLAGVKVHIPAAALLRYRMRKLAKLRAGLLHHPMLRALGVNAPPNALTDDVLLELHAHADLLSDLPIDVARSLAFHHPQLGSIEPDTAAVVMDGYINQSPDLYAFATQISALGPATDKPTPQRPGWATITPFADANGAPQTWDAGNWAGQPAGSPIMQYKISEQITGSPDALPVNQSGVNVINYSLRGTQDDDELKGQLWSVSPGSPAAPAASTVKPQGNLLRDDGGYSFTLQNKTPGYGLDIESGSIDFKSDGQGGGTFAITSKNSYLRTLGAYVQFRDSTGAPISPKGWKSRVPLGVSALETDTKKYIDSVSAVNNIMGVPLPPDPTRLSFPWPTEAASVDLMFGGLGNGNWDTRVDMFGVIQTGLYQYAVPSIFLVVGASIKNSGWYNRFMSDSQLKWAAISVGIFAFGGWAAVDTIENNQKKALATLGNFAGKFIADKALGALTAYVLARVSEAAFLNAVPFIGWVNMVASIAVTAANIAQTTVAVATSPATYTSQVKRTLTVNATVTPDPLHGTAVQKAIWPASATHYVATLQYRDGTNYTTGPRPLPTDPAKRADPVSISFENIPAGGDATLFFGVYSETDWLAGQWSSGWFNLAPDAGSKVKSLQGAIIESLVPLTTSTQYLYQQKLGYDNGGKKHVWLTGSQPAATIVDLDATPTGNHLARLVSLTINDRAYMLGYAWEASGQNIPIAGQSTPSEGQLFSFQNIGALSDPEAGLKFPNCGFTAPAFVGYDQFGPAPLFALPSSAMNELDKGQLFDNTRATFKAKGYPLPPAATATVVQKTVQWNVMINNAVAYVLLRDSDGSIGVHLAPFQAISQSNFWIDPRGSKHHLRQIVLDATTPIDVKAPLSWGYFQQPTLDAVVIHPAGYALAVCYATAKLEILHFPDKGVKDDQAPSSVLVAGQGLRQGLMLGPCAITVASDGRVLVLEALSQRIQAFDIHGNPTPCFDGAAVCSLPAAGIDSALDQGLVPVSLRSAFAKADSPLSAGWLLSDGTNAINVSQNQDGSLTVTAGGATLSDKWTITDQASATSYDVQANAGGLSVLSGGKPALTLPLSARGILNLGSVDDAIIAAFTQAGLALAQPAKVDGNDLIEPASMTDALSRGQTPPQLVTDVTARGGALAPNAKIATTLAVTTQDAGKAWRIDDLVTFDAYQLTNNNGTIAVSRLRAIAPLYKAPSQRKTTYLDMATETKGYIYTLGYFDEGRNVADYFVDIYQPNGAFLVRTPDASKGKGATGVNGAKLAVDMWRNMYTLNFESFRGPGGRTEPSVSVWTPTTPD